MKHYGCGNVKRYIRWIAGMIMLLSIGGLACCSPKTSEEQAGSNPSSQFLLYYLNKEETALVSQPYTLQTQEVSEQVAELLKKMQEVSESVDMKSPMHLGYGLEAYQIEGRQIVLNVDTAYGQLNPSTEILVRAAIVRTLTQIKGIDCVSFIVGEEPMTDRNGNPVGALTADMFIDNQGSEINAYEQTNIRLYFANSEGTSLVEVDQLVTFSSNIAMERVVMEQLIAGPGNMESYPTINPAVKINSVAITDGVCYVNLDEAFLLQPYDVTPEVTIYSIVNSLAELSNVNKVQILVNGETSILYRETISLDTIFTRNLDLID